jgi:pilus assembly protein CpaB
MNQRTLILFVVALVIAGGASMLMRGRVQPEQADTGVKVLVAVSDISAGSFVRAGKDIAWKDWPKANITPAMITSDTDKIEQYNGAVARRSIGNGETIARNTLVRSSEGGFLSAVLAPGTRAVSISVNATSGNAGFVFPGDHVDLILTHRITMSSGTVNGDSGGAGRTVLASETFAENVRVVAVDQMLDNPENKAVLAKTLTLEVTPKQAEKINVAGSLGTISVSLRSLGSAVAKSGGVAAPAVGAAADGNVDTVTQDSDVSKLIDTRGDGRTRVKVIRGNTSEQVDFLPGKQ